MNDDPRVVHLLRSSVLLGALAAVVDGVWRAAGNSRLAAAAVRTRTQWVTSPPAVRRQRIAVMLLVAVATHLALSVTRGLPPGGLWLAIPALAVVTGVLLLLPVSERV